MKILRKKIEALREDASTTLQDGPPGPSIPWNIPLDTCEEPSSIVRSRAIRRPIQTVWILLIRTRV
jgi:hypothetical protein